VWDYRNATGSVTQSAALNDFREDIVIELYNEAGQKVLAYNVHKCWVSAYQALPELDA
jgi:phage tail-like protein